MVLIRRAFISSSLVRGWWAMAGITPGLTSLNTYTVQLSPRRYPTDTRTLGVVPRCVAIQPDSSRIRPVSERDDKPLRQAERWSRGREGLRRAPGSAPGCGHRPGREAPRPPATHRPGCPATVR